MRPEPETITLGERNWTVRPLTLNQVQEIEPILVASAAAAKGNVAAAMAIVAIALSRDHKDAAAALGEIEAGAPEIGAAMSIVLRLGGFIEISPGEAKAAEAAASISASSIPA